MTAEKQFVAPLRGLLEESIRAGYDLAPWHVDGAEAPLFQRVDGMDLSGLGVGDLECLANDAKSFCVQYAGR
jgi:hypothetical protein